MISIIKFKGKFYTVAGFISIGKNQFWVSNSMIGLFFFGRKSTSELFIKEIKGINKCS